MEVSEELIERQIQLERDAIRIGRDRFLKQNKKIEERCYASATSYGVKGTRTLLPELITIIESDLKKIQQAGVGYAAKELKLLDGIECSVVAAIAIKRLFDTTFSVNQSDTSLQNVCKTIGTAIESEAKIRFFENVCPEYVNYLKKKYWHSSCGTKNKEKIITIKTGRKFDVEFPSWPLKSKIIIGSWIVERIIKVSGWFTTVSIDKTTNLIPTDDFLAIRESIIEHQLDMAPCEWPMLIPPRQWSKEEKGGYLLNEMMNGRSLIRSRSSKLIENDMSDEVFDFINNIQGVGYTLNSFIVDIAEVFYKQRIQVGKFLPQVVLDLPPKPSNVGINNEDRQTYRRNAAEIYNKNHQAVRKSVRTRMMMDLVSRFKDVEEFYLPYSFDYRGRIYPIPSYLNPQEGDFGKSLLKFKQSCDVTPNAIHWLGFHVATTYGLSKSTFEERLQWVKENQDLISAVAIDPIGNRDLWESVDEPWCFLAACEEYHACCITKERKTTNLPVGVDATCSGIQILAGLTGDNEAARMVNVVPSDEPQDVYRTVAEQAKTKLPNELGEHLDRKVTKTTVMTIPYNSKMHSHRQNIKEALDEKGVSMSSKEITDICKAISEAMNEVLPGPITVMHWINNEVIKALNRGDTELNWTSPSGFVVKQRLQVMEYETVKMRLLGSCRFAVSETSEVDVNKHRSATAPNLIHSLDASLLHLAFANYDGSFGCVHDCIYCLAGDMETINQRIRHAYQEIFSTDVLKDFAESIGAETDPPFIGTLDVHEVLDSKYFFS